jgi:RimJ/RimL family protein N-acetyltransferase
VTAEPSTRIRRAGPGDLEAYLDVVEAVASERRWIGYEPPLDREALAERYGRALGADTELRLVAAAGTATVGILNAEEYKGIVSFGMMLVPAWRGRGLGGKLLEELMRWARSRGAHKLTLQVWPHNTAAIALYERYGFVAEGRLRRHWRRKSGELWDAVVMGLVLDDG